MGRPHPWRPRRGRCQYDVRHEPSGADVSVGPYADMVRTVVLGPPPAEISALIARRHALGLDTHDEVWEGEYHMAPAANV